MIHMLGLNSIFFVQHTVCRLSCQLHPCLLSMMVSEIFLSLMVLIHLLRLGYSCSAWFLMEYILQFPSARYIVSALLHLLRASNVLHLVYRNFCTGIQIDAQVFF